MSVYCCVTNKSNGLNKKVAVAAPAFAYKCATSPVRHYIKRDVVEGVTGEKCKLDQAFTVTLWAAIRILLAQLSYEVRDSRQREID